MEDFSTPKRHRSSFKKYTNTPILAALQSDNASQLLFPYLYKKPSTHRTRLNSPNDKFHRSKQRSITECPNRELSPTSIQQGSFFPTEVIIKPKTSNTIKNAESHHIYYVSSRTPAERTPYSKKLGPGYYPLANSVSTPAFSFPISTRFSSDKLEKINCNP